MGDFAVLAVMAGAVSVALIFRWLRIPLWPLAGGLLGAAAVNLGFGLGASIPEQLGLVAQLLIGAGIGATFGPEVFRQFMRFFAPGMLAVTVVLVAGLMFGWAFAAWGLMDPQESMLSLMPGGVGEMVAAAVALDLDGAVVIGAHLVRLFTVVFSLPMILWLSELIYRKWIYPPQKDGG